MRKLAFCAMLLGTLAGSASASTSFLVTPGTATDTTAWGAIGPDGTLFADGQSVNSVGGNLTTIFLGTQATLGGLTSVVCPAVNPTNCSWPNQPSGYVPGDTLLWLEGLDTNQNPVGTGPLTFTFQNAVYGLGLYLQATSAGAFNATLALYNGVTLLGSHNYSSDVNGDPLFLGALDTTADITKVVFSVTSCGSFACDPNDFSADTLQFYSPAAPTPEPATLSLLGGSLAVLAFAARKRLGKGNN